MARGCTICANPSRPLLDRRLASGAAIPPLAAEYGVSKDALRRHQRAHLPLQLVRQQVLEQARDCLDVTRLLALANGASVEVLRQARDARRPDVVLRAVDRVLACLHVQLRLTEQVDATALGERLVTLEERLAQLPNARGGAFRWGR
jgi:hypothetical protein